MNHLAPASVVIPLKNRHGAISLCLKSILDGTVDPEEIVIVDDKSSDNAARWLARKIRKKKPWIQVIYLRTNGVGAGQARQIGITAATRPWIAFLDSDDYWPPDYLQKRISLLKTGYTFICGPYHYTREDGKTLATTRLRKRTVSKWRLLLSNPIANSSVLCSRSLILNSGGYSGLYARNDYATWLRIAWRNRGSIHYDPHGPTVLVTRRHASLSSNKAKMLIYNFKAFREAGFSRGMSTMSTLLNTAHFLIRYLHIRSSLIMIWMARSSSN